MLRVTKCNSKLDCNFRMCLHGVIHSGRSTAKGTCDSRFFKLVDLCVRFQLRYHFIFVFFIPTWLPLFSKVTYNPFGAHSLIPTDPSADFSMLNLAVCCDEDEDEDALSTAILNKFH